MKRIIIGVTLLVLALVLGAVGCAGEEGDIGVVFRDVKSEPSVILELTKEGGVVLQVMQTILVKPTLTVYITLWTPALGEWYWYSFADWVEESPQYTFGFAKTAAAAPDITNHNTSRSNKENTVIVSPDGDIVWTDYEDYLRLMMTLCKAMEEIGPREYIIKLLEKEVPGSASEPITKQVVRLWDKVSSSNYDEALAQMAKYLPYQGTEVSNPGDITYEELERVESAIEASIIVMGKAADLVSPNPIGGACMAPGNKGGFAIGGFNAA